MAAGNSARPIRAVASRPRFPARSDKKDWNNRISSIRIN